MARQVRRTAPSPVGLRAARAGAPRLRQVRREDVQRRDRPRPRAAVHRPHAGGGGRPAGGGGPRHEGPGLPRRSPPARHDRLFLRRDRHHAGGGGTVRLRGSGDPGPGCLELEAESRAPGRAHRRRGADRDPDPVPGGRERRHDGERAGGLRGRQDGGAEGLSAVHAHAAAGSGRRARPRFVQPAGRWPCGRRTCWPSWTRTFGHPGRRSTEPSRDPPSPRGPAPGRPRCSGCPQ